jgi:hypothetical protein
VQKAQQENEKLLQELETAKAEYTDRLKVLEETGVAIRRGLAAKIDEVQDKNEKQEEALAAAATATISAKHHRLHRIRKKNEALQNKVQEQEDENSKQAVASARATLNAARQVSGSRMLT